MERFLHICSAKGPFFYAPFAPFRGYSLLLLCPLCSGLLSRQQDTPRHYENHTSTTRSFRRDHSRWLQHDIIASRHRRHTGHRHHRVCDVQ